MRQTLSSASAPVLKQPEVTELLVAWREGNDSALDRLVPLVEAELRQLARRYLRRERPGHVLQTTALVNEAFIRLMNWQDVSWQNRAHFVAMAARLMRHILVDISRRRSKGRDGREILIVGIAEAEEATLERSRDLVAIDDALRERRPMERSDQGGADKAESDRRNERGVHPLTFHPMKSSRAKSANSFV